MKKYWTHYLNDLDSFAFAFEIPINKNNYIEKILQFDHFFLKTGSRHKFLYINNADIENFINEYIEFRRFNFFNSKSKFKSLSLLDFEQCENCEFKFGLKDLHIPVPDLEGHKIRIVEHSEYQPFGKSELIYINNVCNIHKLFWEQTKVDDVVIAVEISSSSNIWWDEFEVTVFEGDIFPSVIEPPIDNRPIAYRITPKFNSFVRDLKCFVEAQSGRVKLTMFDQERVTLEGIKLDGKVIYQEDIDEGRVEIPIDKN